MKTSKRQVTVAVFGAALLTATLLSPVLVESRVAPRTGLPGAAPADGVTMCERLSGLTLPRTTITIAKVVGAGALTRADLPLAVWGGRASEVYTTLPAFCRVAATLAPSSDSDIKIEVWLPATGWNGKFQAVGNGGWAGTISYPALAQAVAAGYAGASTDTGHQGNSGAFALGHPEKVIDMGYRSVHEMTVQAKAIVDAFYGARPTVSFWNGCSQGGRQGITEAQRYPADFDAIVAGAPAVNWMRLGGARMAINLQAHATPESLIPAAKLPMIHEAVLAACDALDGVTDGVIENPSRCTFDPKALLCKDGDGPACLTRAQVDTAQGMYAPIKNPRTGAVLFPALLQPGSELGWATLAGAEPIATALDGFKYVVFKDAEYDWHRFNAATDIDLAEKVDQGVLNSATTDLGPYFKRGGKLMMYHGWSDPQVAPANSVDYFTKVTKTAGRETVGKSIQLYMVPGMNHCSGGPGTDTFNKMDAIERWVAGGRAPESIVASHLTEGKVDRTRPICPHGSVAKWKGSGSTDEAANFACAAQ